MSIISNQVMNTIHYLSNPDSVNTSKLEQPGTKIQVKDINVPRKEIGTYDDNFFFNNLCKPKPKINMNNN